jgi:Fe-S-cluster containining protein
VTSRPPTEVDLDLLRGFRFACRPDCGLCCYAEPRVEASELARLLKIAPSVQLIGGGHDRFIAAKPDGGACQFLAEQRCRVHSYRPHPCRAFPVSVHLGHRAQATLVLTCPGIELGSLLDAPGSARIEPKGLEHEIESIRARLGPAVDARLASASRRGRRVERSLRAEGRWTDDEEVRSLLAREEMGPTSDDFPAEDPPEVAEGLDRLPLFFDGRSAPLALARDLGGWSVVQLAPGGGAETLGVFPPPTQLPRLTPDATRLLRAYLRHVLARDAFLDSVHLDALEAAEGTVLDWVRGELRSLGATVLARGAVRAKLRGEGERSMTSDDVANGIRATDLDWLDRPTWGDRL